MKVILEIPDEIIKKLKNVFDTDDIEFIIHDLITRNIDDKNSRIEMYIKLSNYYLEKAFKHLELNELTQASKKGWGAAALIVKAYAEKHGLRHFRHRDLEEIVEQIYKKLKDKEIVKFWSSALRLHSNFYENFMSKETIELHLHDVKEFVNKVIKLLGN